MLLAVALILTLSAGIIPMHSHAASSFTTVGGWNETLYATISGISDSDVTAVTYSGPSSGSLTGADFEYLVRATSGGVRLDILGLKPGTYSLTVTTKSGEYSASGIVVPEQDRSGFAHDGYTEGVGAYNDDGTLKKNAIVLYVTNSNKNSLTLTAPDGTSVAGIGHILNSCGAESADGLTSKGGAANNNKGILKKLAEADIPLCVRIIGNVSTPDGVTEFDSINYGGIKGDNGSMVRMTNCKNITIEGVGASTVVNGWGFSFIAGTGDYAAGYGKNFEVRNIRFENVPEDCIGLEGQQVGDELTDPIQRCWVHNCSFISPYFPEAPAADKRNGDGACDWKRGLYYTNSYNHYDAYKKTNLVGSNDDCLQYHATFHHNYWNDCAARAPLVRQADVHMYNNIWYSMVDYCISPRASCYVFYEYGYFVENGDVLESSGDTDGYANVYENNKNDPSADVTDKAAAIKSSPLAGTYVERGDYSLQTDIEEMKATVYSTAGPQPASGDASLDPDAPSDESGSDSNVGGYIHNFTAHGLENEFYSISGALATNKGKVTYGSLTLTQCLVFDSSDDYIKFTAPVAGTLTMVFGGSTSDKNNKINLNGTQYIIDSNNQLIADIAAGEYTITKGDVVHIWYMKYVPSEEIPGGGEDGGDDTHTHSYTSIVTKPTCTAQGYTTHACQCGDSYQDSYVAALGHSYNSVVTAPTCTAQGYTTHKCANCGDSYVDTYVDATGHSYSGGVCQNCGAEDPATHIHSYSEAVTAPTCTAQGYTTYTCACGDSYTGNTVAATGHSYASKVTAPTCTAQGYTTYTCSACGDSYKGAYVAATGHKFSGGKCSVCGTPELVAESIIDAGGHLETAYVEWTDISGATGYNVYVAKSGGNYVQLDTELIRKYPGYWRADAVGLAAGSYMLKVVPVVDGAEQTDMAMETKTLTVLAHDRSGYAHSDGYNVGAYNADGTLKSNAKVFYITKDTVNTVSITENGKTYTGLGKLVKEYARTTTYPIVIRIIGEVPVPSATTNGQIEIKGNIVPVTVEGIGEDATCNRWGFKLSSCENVEVRNLGFMNNDSSEGDSVTLQYAVRSWVHNCDFFYGEPGSDADQVKGDGALDTKHSTYVTHSYNHFWDCGKVNLQGSGSSDTSNYITYHHNWYDHSDSRHPRVRIATVHVYNNYYDGNAGYGIGAARGSDIFVENNYFRNCMYPMLISDQGSDTTETMSGEPGGMIKAYGNVIVGETGFIPYTSGSTSFDAYVASSRDEKVPSSVAATNGGATYNNFDTAADFYDYDVDTAQVGAEKTVAYSGRVGGGDFQWEFDDEVDDPAEEVNQDLKDALLGYKTTLVSVGGNSVPGDGGTAGGDETHTHSYTSSVTKAATCTEAGIKTFTCSCGNSYTETIKATGHSEVTVAGKAATCTATGLTDGKKCSVCGEVTVAQTEIAAKGHSYTSSLQAPTCTEAGVRTYTCSTCGDSYTESVAAAGHTEETVAGKAATCTEKGLTEGIKCNTCGEILTSQTEIPALGHKFVDGFCSVCGAADPDYVAGVTVSGKYTSYNDAADVLTIQLIAEGKTEPAYVFTNEADPANSGEWSIDGVAAGNYTVKVMKADHVTREYALTVGNTAVTQNVKICLLGDVNNDGNVNISDYVSILTQVKNPGEPVLVDYYRQCADTDGNGTINFMDYLALLSHVKNVNRLW